MTRQLVVLETRTLSPSVQALVFACVDGAPLGHVPGQWVNLHVNVADRVEKRAYSVASSPNPAHPERFEIAVTRVDDGSVSLALHALRVGATLTMDGPHGFFTRERHATPALFVATGTGVCPLRAMIEAELGEVTGPKLALLFGCRSEADLLYREQYETWRSHSRFTLHVTLSQPSAAWQGLRGYVQTHLATLIDPAAKPHVYVCGLSRMVSEVRRTLKDELGFARQQIHSERYD